MKNIKKSCLILISLCFFFPAFSQAEEVVCENDDYAITFSIFLSPDERAILDAEEDGGARLSGSEIRILEKRTGKTFHYLKDIRMVDYDGDFYLDAFTGGILGLPHRVLELHFFHEERIVRGSFKEILSKDKYGGIENSKLYSLKNMSDPIICDDYPYHY